MTKPNEYPAVVRLQIAITNTGDTFTYKWFTKTKVSSFDRHNGTSSPDTDVENAEEFAEYCAMEIAEQYFGTRWPVIQNIIEVSVESFRLPSYNLPYGIESRYFLDLTNSLNDLHQRIMQMPNDAEALKQYMMVIMTQLQRPDRRILEALGVSESQAIKQLRINIVREFENVQNDRMELMRMFAMIETAIDEHYQMPGE